MKGDGPLGKLRTLLWFLARPAFYGQMVRAARYRVAPHPGEHTREEATAWCRERAVSTAEALEALLGGGERRPFAEVESRRYQVALQAAEAVPVFMGGPGDLDLLYHLARREGTTRVVETGVAFGWSSFALLAAVEPHGRVVSTDMPYVRGGNEPYVGIVVPADLRPAWTLLRSPDRWALPRALEELGSLHLCHYDSDKTYVGRMWAYPRLWAALEPGGFFVSDDVGDNVAFRDFALSTGSTPLVVRPSPDAAPNRYVGILVR